MEKADPVGRQNNDNNMCLSLSEKCPNKEFFLVRIFLYSLQILKNRDQEKLRIWTFFTQCLSSSVQLVQIFCLCD